MPATSSAPTGSSIAPVATITPVSIDPGSDTGTAVSKTIASLRTQVSGLQGSLSQNAQRLADLRNAGAEAATAYHEAKAHITTRLQIGTTRGNPELVNEWNTAQAALDQLSGDINGLNALGTGVAGDASTAHYSLDQITATFNVSGAVDEDHRQLSVLEDETNQTIVLVDRLLTEVSDDVQRQTAYVANERANLTTLASAIKNGELYGADLGSPMMSASAGGRRYQFRLFGHTAGRHPVRSSWRRLPANSLCGAKPSAAEPPRSGLRGRRGVADARNRNGRPAGADCGRSLCAGRYALDD